jgi:hypothetical protein
MIKKINDRNKKHRSLLLYAPERTAFVLNFELLRFAILNLFRISCFVLRILFLPGVSKVALT